MHKHKEREKEWERTRENERDLLLTLISLLHMFLTHHVKALTEETAQVRIVRTRRKKLKISVLYVTSLCIQTLSLTFKQQCLFSYINTHIHLHPEYTHLNAHTWANVSKSVFKDAKISSSKGPCLPWSRKTGRYEEKVKGETLWNACRNTLLLPAAQRGGYTLRIGDEMR